MSLVPYVVEQTSRGERSLSLIHIYGRQRKTKRGSEKLFEVTDQILKENIAKGNLPE